MLLYLFSYYSLNLVSRIRGISCHLEDRSCFIYVLLISTWSTLVTELMAWPEPKNSLVVPKSLVLQKFSYHLYFLFFWQAQKASKGAVINDVTQIWTFFNPPLSHSYVLSLIYLCRKKINPLPLIAWRHLWMIPVLKCSIIATLICACVCHSWRVGHFNNPEIYFIKENRQA